MLFEGMKTMNVLPDQNHIELIRSHLWSGREFGQASVMVGAGFSLNADKTTSNKPDFPVWGGIATALFDALYPNPNDPTLRLEWERNRRESTVGNNPIKLAEQYDKTFGRISLNTLLRRVIPDEFHKPGRLHQLLLQLPWSDIFTTNYDTLLERTRPTVHNIKYDLIQTRNDIPHKMKPRIVKLHGSFPSHDPFIITEEDYRTYPTRFAPFVNMVQQSIMENVHCLIGFSGEDINFLYWSGWVRDNLGPSAPTIYLCGLLNLSQPQKDVLKSRNVVPIDLSPLFPQSQYGANRHRKALEWFLLSLWNGAKPNPLTWPNPPRI